MPAVTAALPESSATEGPAAMVAPAPTGPATAVRADQFLGDGGDGGHAGAGSTPDGLPALGGAGGNAGALGIHGAVGDFGTGVTSGSDSIGTTGSWLTNNDGQVVMLHGLNEVYKVDPGEPRAGGFSDDDAAFLAANGFNAVRVGIIWSDLEPGPGVFNTAYLASIEQTVQTLANHGIHSILERHQDAYSSDFGGEGAPAWAVLDGQSVQPPAALPVQRILQSRRDSGLGFVLVERRRTERHWATRQLRADVGVRRQRLQRQLQRGRFRADERAVRRLADAADHFRQLVLRQPRADPVLQPGGGRDPGRRPHHADLLRTERPLQRGHTYQLGTVDATNTVFLFHDYCEFDLGSLGCLPSVSGIVGNALNYAHSQGIPAFMTEFGATSNQTQLADPMQGANQNLIGWTEWAYTGQGDITTTASPPSSESLVYNPELPPTGTNVNTANLDTLAEPYPQVISGTPTSWSFADGTFDFSYSTGEADGMGSFPGGSLTTISVPTVEFPNGYTVAVTGGEVISDANAPELIISSDSGASTVSVVVTATADGGAGAG